MRFFGIELRKIKNDSRDLPVSDMTTGGVWYYSPKMSVGELLANATVSSCVNIIADAVASLSCNVYKKSNKDGRVKDEKQPLSLLLKRNPNKNDTKFTFFQQIMLHLLLRGNAFIFIERNADYSIKALTPLDPDKVEIKRDEKDDIYYIYTCDGRAWKYNTDMILHIPAIRYNCIRGISPMEYATHSAKTGLQLEEYTANYFDGGIHSKLLVTASEKMGKLTKEDAQKTSEIILNAYGGKRNANKPIVLSNGFTAQPLNLDGNNDAQLVENRAFSEKEIAKIFRVPLFMLGSENSKFSNMEQANTYFLQQTLTPWLVRLQEYLNRLLPEFLQGKYYVEFDTNTMLRADYAARWNNYRENFKNGLFTLNQIMDMENLPHVDESIGDKHYMQAQYNSLEDGPAKTNDTSDDNAEDPAPVTDENDNNAEA